MSSLRVHLETGRVMHAVRLKGIVTELCDAPQAANCFIFSGSLYSAAAIEFQVEFPMSPTGCREGMPERA